MKELVVLVEGIAERALLDGLLPRLVPAEIPFRIIPFDGKQDLERQMMRKIRAYRNPHATFLVMRDQDRDDCHTLKARLHQKCVDAGRPDALVRIACHESETFFLGDLEAVELAFDLKGLSQLQAGAKFRNPDHLQHPSRELKDLTGGAYQKVQGSRALAPLLRLDNSTSRSFYHLVQAIQRLCAPTA